MNKLRHSILLLILLSQLSLSSQISDYYEYINHKSPFGDFSNFLPISDKGAYVVRNASLIKIEGKKETVIYSSRWFRASSKFLITENDTIVFFYNYTATDFALDIVTKITINQDSIQVLNHGDRECRVCEDCPFYYYPDIPDEFPCLDVGPKDFVLDSLGQIIMATTEAIYRVEDNLDTVRLSTFASSRNIRFLKNQKGDLFYKDGNSVYALDNNFETEFVLDTGQQLERLENHNGKNYLQLLDQIRVYDSQFELLIETINIDLAHGRIVDFTVSNNEEVFVIQEDESNISRTLKYDYDGNNELIYIENLEDTYYKKIENLGSRIYCIGQNKATPIIKSQPMEFSEPYGNPDLRIDNIEILMDSTITPNCNYGCINYFYNARFEVTNMGTDSIFTYNIANFRFPLDFSFSFNSLKWNFGYNTNIAVGESHEGFGNFDTQFRYRNMYFEIIGANFLPDRNPSNNILESNDIISGIRNTVPQLENVSIYPIPANEVVNIEAPEEIKTVQVFSLDGQLHYATQSRKNITDFKVDKLPPGVYIVQLWNADKSKVATKKMIVK